MISKLSITIVVDDTAGTDALVAEHGLSLWVEADGMRILFDTGQSDALMRNARALGIDLSAADAVVLSHGHYDHTGGLAAVLDKNTKAPVYCHPGAVVPRYSLRPDGTYHSIGIPSASLTALFNCGRVQWISRPHDLGDSIGLTGPVPRLTRFEDTGGNFFLDPAGKYADPVEDDLSMMVSTNQGLVIVTGCCHSGIVNTVRHIRQLRPGEKICAIMGGLHLLNASAERLDQTIAEFKGLPLERIVACHCTGESATQTLKSSLKDIAAGGAAGEKFDFT
ncbi:MAG: MBL fold metallo-hydrolase [Chitinispirillaceae bacterium]|nr:MBL fold metallo-hydrolase [Chitinispirillaceae bacterium]